MSFSNTPVCHHRKTFEQVIAPLTQDAIALNESLWEPDAHTRATAEGWRQYREGSTARQHVGIDWRLLKQFTGYTREDLIGFAIDEGLPTVSGKFTPHEARMFRDVILCNWAMVEDYFSEHWQAREALADLRRMLPWTAGEQELLTAWARACAGQCGGQAARFYLEDAA